MNLPKSQRSCPAEQLAPGSKFDPTDPDYEDHRIQRMRAEYRSLASEWRDVYLAGLSKKDVEALTARGTT